ncbi:unnamed protein product [Microthlaspi erraticum]|uniref:Uncharacterized protein n=1 Tax=Microthlaspi erraticum TaxID=1685480 RepID=A0A6D2KBF7_9BRAS|nr:unnamed protein product [Microthlaspi erraticum]
MARTKGGETMKKKKDPSMQPPRKQIKLGSSSCNARAAIPTSPHLIDANQEHVESPRREEDWALVSFVGGQIQDPRKCKKAMEKVNIEPCVKMDTPALDLLKIRDDVTWCLRKLGLSKLFKIECSEYSMLTKEFLSTVALAFPNNNGDQPAGDGLLFFKILQDRRCQWAHLDVFWSILEHMGREEHGGTWHMDAAQLDTQRKKEKPS